MSGSRYNFPIYIRKVSTSSDHDTADVSGRTVSSSSAASMMSTPSNNVRRVLIRQQQTQIQPQTQNNGHQGHGHFHGDDLNTNTNTTPYIPKVGGDGSSGQESKIEKEIHLSSRPDQRRKMKKPLFPKTTNTNVKSKLLNLLRSSKIIQKNDIYDAATAHINETLETLTFKKIENKTFNDISSFAIPVGGPGAFKRQRNVQKTLIDGTGASDVATDQLEENKNDYCNKYSFSTGNSVVPVKDSQVKAWESAQQISSHLLFDESSDNSDDDSSSLHNIIKSIPGYTKNELDLLKSRYIDSIYRNKSLSGEEFFEGRKREEEQMIWELQQRHQVSQERIFAQTQSLVDKRKIQIQQKKEVLERIFGSTNNLNQNFITNNNTTYSMGNSQMMFQEDKEEISQLIEENDSYNNSIVEMNKLIENSMNPSFPFQVRKKGVLMGGSGINGNDIDVCKFQKIVSMNLSKNYHSIIDNGDPQPKQDEDVKELQNASLGFLRNRIKRDEE